MTNSGANSWNFDKTIRLDDIIKWFLLIGLIVGAYFNLKDTIEDHIAVREIHQTAGEKEKIFVKKEIYAKDREIIELKLGEINRKLDDLLRGNNKGR